MSGVAEKEEKLALVLDTETTGLDVEVHEVIEVGAALLDVTTRTVARTFSTLLYAEENPAESVNGIPRAALDLPLSRRRSIEPLLEMFEASSWIVAHNAGFDRGMMEKLFRVLTIEPPHRAWVCSATQLRFPNAGSSRRLSHLAVDHGIVIADAHRALSDVLTLCSLLQRLDDLEAQLDDALIPRRLFVADVSYDHRQLAKERGFAFCGKSRQWRKRLTEAEATALPFGVFPVEG
jgi:DNA polymerase-3 subunit epsilon